MMTTTFSVPGTPVPTPRMTKGGIYAKEHRNRKQIEAYFRYKDEIGWSAKAAGIECIADPTPVELTVRFYLPNARNRDTSNLLKAVEDALNQIAYDDDKQVVTIQVSKQTDRAEPRTEIQIQARPDWQIEV